MQIIELERFFSEYFYDLINNNRLEIEEDYNEASYLYPFWENYPPDERGRQPIGDQYPWIEVGEHVLGGKIPRLMGEHFKIRDYGLPTGPDERFVVESDDISSITDGFINSCWLFIDIKSVGPRDDQDHTVMSHNQISGNGLWETYESGITNDTLIARGRRTYHEFYCTIPPVYILNNLNPVLVIHIVIKPVYKMLGLHIGSNGLGQPLNRIDIITIPNGILLTVNPNYLNSYPHLLFPGKDDKGKNPRKVRARISFAILRNIANWRIQSVKF